MGLNILHTSDWHLGKKLYKVSRLEEQKLFLKWLIELIKEEEVDALCLSGDVFDSPRPSDQALKVYFNFLQDFTEQTNAQLYIISGNHDSGQFLEAPQSLLKARGRIHLSGVFDSTKAPSDYLFELKKENGPSAFFSLIPYFRSYDLEQAFCAEESDTTEGAQLILKNLESFCLKLSKLAQEKNPTAPHFLLAHHLFGSFQEAGSEQGLFLSGLETIPLRTLGQSFDYVALGHIHKAQTVKSLNPQVRYSGSPLPFRFSENKDKLVYLIQTQESSKDLNVYKKTIPCFRHLISLTTDSKNYLKDFEEALKKTPTSSLAPLCEVKCYVDAPVSGISDLLRHKAQEYGAELLNVQILLPQEHSSSDEKTTFKASEYSSEKLFLKFYAEKFPDRPTPTDELYNQFKALLETVRENRNRLDSDEQNGEKP